MRRQPPAADPSQPASPAPARVEQAVELVPTPDPTSLVSGPFDAPGLAPVGPMRVIRKGKGMRIADILRAIGSEPVSRSQRQSKIEDVMRRVYHFARRGEAWAVQFIADRTEGKPIQLAAVGQVNANLSMGGGFGADSDGGKSPQDMSMEELLITAKRVLGVGGEDEDGGTSVGPAQLPASPLSPAPVLKPSESPIRAVRRKVRTYNRRAAAQKRHKIRVENGTAKRNARTKGRASR